MIEINGRVFFLVFFFSVLLPSGQGMVGPISASDGVITWVTMVIFMSYFIVAIVMTIFSSL